MKAQLLGFLILFVSLLVGDIYGQIDNTERGIIIYDPSNLGDEFTVAKVFKSATRFTISTTVVFSDGTKDQIVGDLIRGVISFPSENASSHEYRATADTLKQFAATYPRAFNLLSASESLLRAKAIKIGKIEALQKRQAKQIGRIVSFSDNSGESYVNVELQEIEPDGITIKRDGDKKKLLFTQLPKEIQDFLGYDPIIASDYALSIQMKEQEARRMAAAQSAQLAAREARQKEGEEMAAARTAIEQLKKEEAEKIRLIIEIESDLSSFIGKTVSVEGAITIDSYYNYEYGELRDSHYCFKVTDKRFDSAHVYARKNSETGLSLREQLLKAEGPLKGRVSFQINSNRLVDYQTSILADLVGFGPSSE